MSSRDNCWICDIGAASSGEHLIKRSDLASVFISPTQKNPLYMHTHEKKNIPIGSFKSDKLKFSKTICHDCNTTKTQPHDKAWDEIQRYFSRKIWNEENCNVLRANKIFPYDTGKYLRWVHLYFVKIAGCHFWDNKLNVDLSGFSRAILNSKSHPSVYLKFLFVDGGYKPEVGMTDIEILVDKKTEVIGRATWIHYVHKIAVQFLYQSIDGCPIAEGFWHPKNGSKIKIEKIKHGGAGAPP